MPVQDCMTTCSSQDSVDKATELMRENQIRRITVVNEQHRLVGIVSLGDIVGRANMRTAETHETHETLKTVSAPTPEPSKPRARSRKAA
jgi:CBS-domain-containing membrane protein